MNSTKAIQEHGAISIMTSHVNDVIIIEMSDTGNGIPAEIISKVFDPFFTTSDVGGGIGLGLTITRVVIVSHGGVIEVESLPGNGASFTIRLPTDQSAGINI